MELAEYHKWSKYGYENKRKIFKKFNLLKQHPSLWTRKEIIKWWDTVPVETFARFIKYNPNITDEFKKEHNEMPWYNNDAQFFEIGFSVDNRPNHRSGLHTVDKVYQITGSYLDMLTNPNLQYEDLIYYTYDRNYVEQLRSNLFTNHI